MNYNLKSNYLRISIGILQLLWISSHAQDNSYGLGIGIAHTFSLSNTQTQHIAQDRDEAHIHPSSQLISYSYDHEIGAIKDYGYANSKLMASVTPGLLRYSWLGNSSVARSVGNMDTSADAKSDLWISMLWEDHITISSNSKPSGTPVTLLFSHSLHGHITLTPTEAPNNSYLQIDANLQISGSTVDPDGSPPYISRFSAKGSMDEYRVLKVPTRIGDVLRISMMLYTQANTRVAIYGGVLGNSEVPSAVWNLGGYDSNRLGIRSEEADVTITAASGHVYPTHAMSANAINLHLSNLQHKGPLPDPEGEGYFMVLDGIPAVSYQLQWSKTLRADDWHAVGSPVRPETIGEVFLPFTINNLDTMGFWRVAASPVTE